jgi:hypothetical protein
MPPIQYDPVRIDPRMSRVADLCLLLADTVRAEVVAARQRHRIRTRRSWGGTLRPGTGTPLWNALAAEARVLTKAYGAKAALGRHLGVPRQRIHEYLRAGSGAPDAERTLELLLWIARHRSFSRRAASLQAELTRHQ